MEDPRLRKYAKFLINSAVGLKAGEKILIELHGSETKLLKILVGGLQRRRQALRPHLQL